MTNNCSFQKTIGETESNLTNPQIPWNVWTFFEGVPFRIHPSIFGYFFGGSVPRTGFTFSEFRGEKFFQKYVLKQPT